MANWQILESDSTGENVRTAQYLLNQHGASVAVEGDFGPATKAAFEAFQAAYGLTADGVVGNETWPALSGAADWRRLLVRGVDRHLPCGGDGRRHLACRRHRHSGCPPTALGRAAMREHHR